MENRLNFRFWHELEKRWFYFNFNNFYMYQERIQKYCLDDGKQIYQSTGLKDKNGNLIYEGDILELELNELGVALHSTKKIKNGVVRIPDGMFVAQCFDTKNHCTAFCQEHWEKAEIIGNIYENLELLEIN